jgi:hypothetical protein
MWKKDIEAFFSNKPLPMALILVVVQPFSIWRKVQLLTKQCWLGVSSQNPLQLSYDQKLNRQVILYFLSRHHKMRIEQHVLETNAGKRQS